MKGFTHEILRILLLVVTMPLWLPFLKALWREVNKALRREGGVFGRVPTSRELRELERQGLDEDEALTNEPIRRPGTPRAGAASRPGTQRAEGSGRAAAGRGGRLRPARRSRGFR